VDQFDQPFCYEGFGLYPGIFLKNCGWLATKLFVAFDPGNILIPVEPKVYPP
jgi:hypothetical protein